MELLALVNPVFYDVPDDPVIETVNDGNTPVLIAAVVIVALLLIYFLFIRKKKAA